MRRNETIEKKRERILEKNTEEKNDKFTGKILMMKLNLVFHNNNDLFGNLL